MAEAVDHSHLFDDARAFLADLAQNNTRDWFSAHKATYDSKLKRPAEAILTALAPLLERLGGAPVRPKLFRPHRDLRFSEDKTPYHTHLHMLWAHPDGRGWFCGIAADYATAGAGVMGFDKAGLDRWREAVAGPPGEALVAILDNGDWRVDSPALKRVPEPFLPDHPRAALLRCKGLVAWRDGLDEALRADPRAALESAFAQFAPLQGWLHRVV